MISSLRRKIILIAMASLVGTMAVRCTAIGIGNHCITTNRADRAISLLCQNGGNFFYAIKLGQRVRQHPGAVQAIDIHAPAIAELNLHLDICVRGTGHFCIVVDEFCDSPLIIRIL